MAPVIQRVEQIYKEALIYAPRDPKVLNNLAYLLAETLHQPEAALPYAETAVQVAPRLPAVLDTLGRTRFLLGHPADAVPVLTGAAKAAPDDPEIQLHLAEALGATGQGGAARSILEKLAGAPTDSPIRVRARALLKRG